MLTTIDSIKNSQTNTFILKGLGGSGASGVMALACTQASHQLDEILINHKGKCHLRILILDPVLSNICSICHWSWYWRRRCHGHKFKRPGCGYDYDLSGSFMGKQQDLRPNSLIHRILAGFNVDNGAGVVITMWSNWSLRILNSLDEGM